MPVSARRQVPVLIAAAIAAALFAGCRAGSGAAARQAETRRPRRADASLLFLGDINMGRTLGRRLRAGETEYPLAGIQEVVGEADFACAALEVQVSDLPGTVGEPNSLTYCAPAVAARVMKDAGFDAVWSANNHMWDYGRAPLLDTIANLDAVGLPHTGVGQDLEEAYRPVVAEVGGWRVATLSVTSIFNSEFRGEPARMVAWADLDRTRDAIVRVRPSVDFLVVNHHGGVEYSEGPTRAIMDFDRACIDAGADAVVGSHPHVFQGGEWWQGKPILYSVGNLVFVQHPAWTDAGLGLRVRLREGALPAFEILGLRVHYQPRFLEDTLRYRERFRALSRRFAEPLVWGEDGRVAPPAQG